MKVLTPKKLIYGSSGKLVTVFWTPPPRPAFVIALGIWFSYRDIDYIYKAFQVSYYVHSMRMDRTSLPYEVITCKVECKRHMHTNV